MISSTVQREPSVRTAQDHFAPGAVHYFPPDMYEGPFRGARVTGVEVAADDLFHPPGLGRPVLLSCHSPEPRP